MLARKKKESINLITCLLGHLDQYWDKHLNYLLIIVKNAIVILLSEFQHGFIGLDNEMAFFKLVRDGLPGPLILLLIPTLVH